MAATFPRAACHNRYATEPQCRAACAYLRHHSLFATAPPLQQEHCRQRQAQALGPPHPPRPTPLQASPERRTSHGRHGQGTLAMAPNYHASAHLTVCPAACLHPAVCRLRANYQLLTLIPQRPPHCPTSQSNGLCPSLSQMAHITLLPATSPCLLAHSPAACAPPSSAPHAPGCPAPAPPSWLPAAACTPAHRWPPWTPPPAGPAPPTACQSAPAACRDWP